MSHIKHQLIYELEQQEVMTGEATHPEFLQKKFPPIHDLVFTMNGKIMEHTDNNSEDKND